MNGTWPLLLGMGVLMLGAGLQGTLLSLHHGFYPHVASRDTTASGALAESRSTHFTRTGLSRSVVVPSPSSPAALYPQQYAAPPVVTPQV